MKTFVTMLAITNAINKKKPTDFYYFICTVACRASLVIKPLDLSIIHYWFVCVYPASAKIKYIYTQVLVWWHTWRTDCLADYTGVCAVERDLTVHETPVCMGQFCLRAHENVHARRQSTLNQQYPNILCTWWNGVWNVTLECSIRKVTPLSGHPYLEYKCDCVFGLVSPCCSVVVIL